MISNQVILNLFSRPDMKNLSEDARVSAIKRLSEEAGIEVETSQEMFEKIMSRAQRIRSEMKPLGGPARRKVLARKWTIPSTTLRVEEESEESRLRREVLRLRNEESLLTQLLQTAEERISELEECLKTHRSGPASLASIQVPKAS